MYLFRITHQGSSENWIQDRQENRCYFYSCVYRAMDSVIKLENVCVQLFSVKRYLAV